jgi:hypothetical protein
MLARHRDDGLGDARGAENTREGAAMAAELMPAERRHRERRVVIAGRKGGRR